jgi:hypothetical protein
MINQIQQDLNFNTSKEFICELTPARTLIMHNTINFVLNKQQNISSEDLVMTVLKELAGPNMAINKQEVSGVLDIMIDDGYITFDTEEDRWCNASHHQL